VAASSGKALWRAAPTRNTTFDLLLCLARGVWMEAAVSMYRSGRLAWCAGRPRLLPWLRARRQPAAALHANAAGQQRRTRSQHDSCRLSMHPRSRRTLVST
jgi:hypothetical protein